MGRIEKNYKFLNFYSTYIKSNTGIYFMMGNWTKCLFGFVISKINSTIEICLDHQKNSANAVIRSHKSHIRAGSAEKIRSQDNVLFVDQNLDTKHQPTSKHVQGNVLINCGERKIQFHSQEKSEWYANIVEQKSWYRQHIKTEDFVHLLAGMNTMLEKETRHGGAESHLNGQCLTHQESGKKLVKLFGKEIMQPVGTVESDLTTLKELLKFITSAHSGTKNTEQKLTTLYSFVIRAIIGCIPQKILNQNTFTIELNTQTGWTFGVSDTQRYKMMGNAVTTNVIAAIGEKLLEHMEKNEQQIHLQEKGA